MNIFQDSEFITLGDRAFPAQFLRDRNFPPLPEGIVSRRYEPGKKLFCQSNGKNQTSAGSLPWEEGDKFLEQKEGLWHEYQESLKPPEPDPQTESEVIPIFDPAVFANKAMASELYNLAKTSPNPAVQVEKGEIQVIIGGYLIFSRTTIAPGGLLEKNLRELLTALGNVPQSAIDEFNQLLANDLGVEWKIGVPQ